MKRKNAGFALVDVLMAIVLLSFGIYFITSLLAGSQQNVKQAQTLTQAAYVAEQVKDTLRTQSFGESDTMKGEESVGETQYEWEAKKSDGETGTNQVMIQVTWKDIVGGHKQLFMTVLPVR